MPRFLASLAAVTGLIASTGASAVEISICCSGLGKEYEICKQGVDAWAKKTGNTVRIVSTPNSATERLALYQQLLAAGAPDVMFSRDRQDPTASVVVRLRDASGLPRNQVAAIQHLVASSVAGLKPARVSIIDDRGNLLARGSDGDDNSPQATAANAEEMRRN